MLKRITDNGVVMIYDSYGYGKVQDMLNGFGLWLADRLKEPSTWAGSGVAAAVLHSWFPGAEGNAILAWCGATAAVLAIVLPEKKNGGTHIHVTPDAPSQHSEGPNNVSG